MQLSEERQDVALAGVRSLRSGWANLGPPELVNAFRNIIMGVQDEDDFEDPLPPEQSENQSPTQNLTVPPEQSESQSPTQNLTVPPEQSENQPHLTAPPEQSENQPPTQNPIPHPLNMDFFDEISRLIQNRTNGQTQENHVQYTQPPEPPQRPWGLDIAHIADREDTTTRFATILGYYHTVMAPPTPPSRPQHSQPRPRQTFGHLASTSRNGRTRSGSRLRARHHSRTRDQFTPSRVYQGPLYLVRRQRSIEALLNQHFEPSDLSRADLQHHASSSALNPDGLAWHSLRFIARIQRLRKYWAHRIRRLINHRLVSLRTETQRQLDEAEAVQAAVMILALCNSLTDSRDFLAAVDPHGSDDRYLIRDTVAGTETRRPWIPSAQILSRRERGALSAALTRRSALGRRMGLLSELEDVYGEVTGRQYFDYWVAQAVRSVVVTTENGNPAGEENDSAGALWEFVEPLLAASSPAGMSGSRHDIRTVQDQVVRLNVVINYEDTGNSGSDRMSIGRALPSVLVHRHRQNTHRREEVEVEEDEYSSDSEDSEYRESTHEDENEYDEEDCASAELEPIPGHAGEVDIQNALDSDGFDGGDYEFEGGDPDAFEGGDYDEFEGPDYMPM